MYIARVRSLLVALIFTALLLPCAPAAAEDGPSPEEVQARIKKKMDEIRRLMKENEEALLALSTGGQGRTRRVDVEVPEGTSSPRGSSSGGTSSGGSSSGGSGKGAGGTRTGEIERRLRELAGGQRKRGERIPTELQELIRMIPSRSGQGQGQPRDGKPQQDKGEPSASELRDARRKRLEEQRKAAGKPERGDKSPRERADRTKTGKPEKTEAEKAAARDPKNAPWFTALPPEIREALAGGQAERIPENYRHLIQRYNLFIQKQQRKGR